MAGLPGVAKHFVRLVGVATTEDLGPARQMMVLEPYAELIPFNIDPCELARLMRSFVTIVIRLHQSGYMHLDLSYFNLLMYNKEALLADLQTMRPNDEVSQTVVIIKRSKVLEDGQICFIDFSTILKTLTGLRSIYKALKSPRVHCDAEQQGFLLSKLT